MQLPRHPAHALSKLLWDLARLRASHLCKHYTVAVALNELHRNIEVQQTCHRFIRHRPGKHIAPDHYLIYSCLTNVLEYSLKDRKSTRLNSSHVAISYAVFCLK